MIITLTILLNMTLFSCSESDGFLNEPQKFQTSGDSKFLCCSEESELTPPPSNPTGN